MKASKERETELQAELKEKFWYISQLEEELQAKRKKTSTPGGQLEEKENEDEKLQQKSKQCSSTHFVKYFYITEFSCNLCILCHGYLV